MIDKNGVIAPKRAELLKLRFDPLLSIVAAAEYGVDNLNSLAKRGVVGSNIQDDDRARLMYLAHHEGPSGAFSFLKGTKKYTAKDLAGQVGKSTAENLVKAGGGDANKAYRDWLSKYIAEKIVPDRFRDGRGGAAVVAAAPARALGMSAVPAMVGTDLPVGPAFVTTEALNFRATPDGTIKRALTIGQRVEVTGPAKAGNWQPVRIGTEDGFLSNVYLRRPIAPSKEALLVSAIAEWVRFDKGKAREETDPYYKYVGEMWKSIKLDYDGRSVYPDQSEVPWSAAFISFVVRKSGPSYENFKFSASHSQFSHDAIQSRIHGRKNRPFWGYRLGEKRPELGDIIHRNRSGGSFSFDFAETNDGFPSHSDIVVEVRKSVIRVVGGNVGETVSMSRMSGGDDLQEYELDSEGFLKPGQTIIAVLKNRSDEVV